MNFHVTVIFKAMEEKHCYGLKVSTNMVPGWLFNYTCGIKGKAYSVSKALVALKEFYIGWNKMEIRSLRSHMKVMLDKL